MDIAGKAVRMVDSGSGNYSGLGIDIHASEVDRLVTDVITAYESSSRSLWNCARLTWKLFDEYGMYERRFTENLVVELAVNRDTIYHWRKAWDLRIEISEANPEFVFDGLSISHFYTAADYVDRMGVDWVMEWLKEAQEGKWSSRTLSAEMQQATNDSGTFQWLKKKLGMVLVRLDQIYGMSESSGISEEDRHRLKQALDLIQDILK